MLHDPLPHLLKNYYYSILLLSKHAFFLFSTFALLIDYWMTDHLICLVESLMSYFQWVLCFMMHQFWTVYEQSMNIHRDQWPLTTNHSTILMAIELDSQSRSHSAYFCKQSMRQMWHEKMRDTKVLKGIEYLSLMPSSRGVIKIGEHTITTTDLKLEILPRNEPLTITNNMTTFHKRKLKHKCKLNHQKSTR